MKSSDRKVIRDSENTWQLEGESDLSAITLPDPPVAGKTTTVRLTHSNSYGPFDDVEFFVRIGDPDEPTDEFDVESEDGWVRTNLVEELVHVEDGEVLRSEVDEESFEDETPWDGTYEAELVFPAGEHAIEIRIISHHPELLASRVLTDWLVTVI